MGPDSLPGNSAEGQNGRSLSFSFDGCALCASEGQSIAAALLAAGRRVFRLTSRQQEPRGVFCGMGVCFDCLVRVDGRPNLRACQTIVMEGMRVETEPGAGSQEVLE